MYFERSLHSPNFERFDVEGSAPKHCVYQLAERFNHCFVDQATVLKAGAVEPFYQAASSQSKVAVIHSTQDYFASALHELAHWCIAGVERRQLDDYGYWYQPDGRDAEQQSEFFQVESKPQALEWAFSLAAGVPFRISLDNLDNLEDCLEQQIVFRESVFSQLKQYFDKGFPARAERVIALLATLYRYHQPIQLPNTESCLL